MVATVMNLNLPCLSIQFETKFQFSTSHPTRNRTNRSIRFPILSCFSEDSSLTTTSNSPPPIRRRRRRYRKYYPGEKKGITEEMRFVAVKLRNNKNVRSNSNSESGDNSDGDIDGFDDKSDGENDCSDNVDFSDNDESGGETWQPSMEGFVKYLADCRLVFSTVERIVDESRDVSYAYFRNTGLERSGSITKDLEWFSQQNVLIPKPSNPGVTYVSYLEELAEKSPPLFLCHFYNIYFSHIAGTQVIGRKASERLLEGREMEFYSWEGDAKELLRGVREKLNMLVEHWSRDEKTR